MTKKKSNPSPVSPSRPSTSSGQGREPEPNPYAEPELVEEQWKVGMWKGFERLECVLCGWDTLDGIEAARARKAECPRCGPTPARPPSPVLIADKSGREKPADSAPE